MLKSVEEYNRRVIQLFGDGASINWIVSVCDSTPSQVEKIIRSHIKQQQKQIEEEMSLWILEE